MVAVGGGLPRSPPHRSRRALLTHRAPVEGQTRSAFGAWAAHTSPIRGRAAAVTCRFRLCVRDMRSDAPFPRPTAFPPPSPPPMSLGFVRGFLGTMQSSDSSCLPAGLRSCELPRLARDRVAAAGDMRPPRFRTKDFSTRVGSPTAQGPSHTRHLSHEMMLPSPQRKKDQHLGNASFAAQYPAHGLPCERFTSALANCRASLGAGAAG